MKKEERKTCFSTAVILHIPPALANRPDDNLAASLLAGDRLEEHFPSCKSPVPLMASGLRGMWFRTR